MTKLTLSKDERRGIFAGSDRALRRAIRPKIKAGDSLILAWSRGGKQIVDYDSGETIEIPRKPTVWIEFRAPELRDGTWLLGFSIQDVRQSTRHLAATPGPRRQAGLKTRWEDGSNVPAKGEETERWTAETARGYTGSARAAIDTLEGVGDDDLQTFAAQARNARAEFRQELEVEQVELRAEARRRRERDIRRRIREKLEQLSPVAQVEFMAKLERTLS